MIDTQAVKNKILNLAMRGQLTEQMQADGIAEDLYVQIIAEKARLVKEGKVKKEKPLGEISGDDIPFEIPGNWKWVYFGEIFSHNTGKALNASDKEGKLLEYITTSNMYWDHFELDNLKEMYFKDEEIEKCTIRKGDLLICEGGDIGRSAIWNFPYEMRIQNHIHKLRPYLKTVSPVFYYYVMRLYKAINMINGQGIGLQGFSSKRVHSLVVPLPPISEQERIVERIEAIFEILDKIDTLQEQYASNQEALRSKLIDAAIQGKLTEQLPEDGTAEDLYTQIQEEKIKLVSEKKIKKEKPLPVVSENEIPFAIPSNWRWVRLGDIAYRIWAGGDKPNDFVEQQDDDRNIPVVANGVTNEGILGYTAKATASKNSITVAGRGTIGFTVYRKYDYCPIVRLIVIEQSHHIEPRYLQIFLQSMPEASVGSSIPQLTVPMIRPKLVPLPPLKEQIRIADRLIELMDVITEN